MKPLPLPTPAPPPAALHPAAGLAERLRAGTRKAHRVTENMAFIRAFLRGLLSRAAYQQLLACLHAVYSHLEAQLERHRFNPVLSALYLPELWRTAALQKDLEYFGAAPLLPGQSAAAAAYVARISELGDTQPTLLVAHAYTRYLGDLSGGQILKKIARRALQLPDQRGLSFYNFPQIGDIAVFKARFRARLDALPLDELAAQAVVAEANFAFALNQRLFSELEGSYLRALLHLLTSDPSALGQKKSPR